MTPCSNEVAEARHLGKEVVDERVGAVPADIAKARFRGALAVELRMQGCSYDELAEILEYSHRSSARKAVMRTIKERSDMAVDAYLVQRRTRSGSRCQQRSRGIPGRWHDACAAWMSGQCCSGLASRAAARAVLEHVCPRWRVEG